MNAARILHVDDEPDIREVVEASLGLDPNFAVRSCASGDDGLMLAADWQPNMILLDVMMPAMDGPTTLTHLRDNPRTFYIPVIFMTVRAQTREIELFRSLGADGVIAKPFDPMTLAASVRNYLPTETSVEALRKAFVRRELRKSFVRRAKTDAAALVPYSSALEEHLNSTVVLRRIRDIAHGLAGSSSILGFHLLSSEAASLENAAAARMNGDGALADVRKAIDGLIAQIETTPTP
jgi:CheY-like chemotaxis protein/HPt (histidine-containing phosphotransfer) domain-containing protein